MRRNPQPSAFVSPGDAGFGFGSSPGYYGQRASVHQIGFEDEASAPGVRQQQPGYHGWQAASGRAALSQSQEGLLDFDLNNNDSTGRVHPTTAGRRPAWQAQRLHRSCNNLATAADHGNHSGELHRGPGIWRGSGDFPGEPELHRARLYSGDPGEGRATNGSGGSCGIGNCGKVLWISRDRDRDRDREGPIGLPTPYGEAPQSQQQPQPGVVVRTNAQGLPYTPAPHQRQAFLANQHAIEAAIPLVVNGGQRRTKSPNRYFESDVNIHYKAPVRYEYKEPVPEEELAVRQAEQMQRLYQEERRRKYLQELQDMNARRHTDHFTPSQKSPIALNRYDDFPSDLAPPKSPGAALQPRTVARALYNFQGQTARELTFKKGDVIYIRRQIDKNWYEGEHNAMIGLLPANYVEIVSKDGLRQPARKPAEGHARAKYNFQAQSGIELSLNKGELVTLTRRVDDNWFEGKIANRKGIFPVSYVEVLSDIGSEDYSAPRAHVSSTSLRPSLDSLRTSINNEFNTLTQNGHQPPNGILRETRNVHKTDVLHVDTSTEPIAYRALYKYRPQNSDELELQEGDVVHVLEKCDDGWFVGTSQRTGCFGTFPGNYVERA